MAFFFEKDVKKLLLELGVKQNGGWENTALTFPQKKIQFGAFRADVREETRQGWEGKER